MKKAMMAAMGRCGSRYRIRAAAAMAPVRISPTRDAISRESNLLRVGMAPAISFQVKKAVNSKCVKRAKPEKNA